MKLVGVILFVLGFMSIVVGMATRSHTVTQGVLFAGGGVLCVYGLILVGLAA